MLDIGLPTLNGIEVARQIRKSCPQCKILFLSQESSAYVVQDALALGALGFVFKAHAGSELLAALEAVLEGRQFVSRGLSGHSLTDATGPQASRFRTQAGSPIAGTEKKEIARIHEVEFYSDDAVFLAGLTQLCRNRSRSREQSDRGCDRVTPERSSPGIAGTWRGYCYCRSARALSPFGCRRDPLKIHGKRGT